MIVVSGDMFDRKNSSQESKTVHFSRWDDGDVYSLILKGVPQEAVPGTIFWATGKKKIPVTGIGNSSDHVRIISKFNEDLEDRRSSESRQVSGYVRHENGWVKVHVQIVPVKDEIFSRFGGLLETDTLNDKRIALFGLGTVGAQIATEAAKSSIRGFYLIDFDRFEVGNISRHVAGLPNVGRKKTNVVEQLIHEINPYAEVIKYAEKVDFENREKFREIVKNVDIVICSTDNRESRRIINRLCVEENTMCIFAGAFRRAYGGQILIVKPFITHCYQCFLMNMPEQAGDEEISTRQQAEQLAYTDRIVPIEPGLSTDIAPINIMVTKLVIQELLKDKDTTLRSLDDDLLASWYIWLNRREKGTPYEKLDPMGFNIDGLCILRWYGIEVERNPACPVCGDYELHLAKKYGIQLPGSDNQKITNRINK